MAGPLGEENGNLWSTGGTQSWHKGDQDKQFFLPLNSRAAKACGASIYLVLRLSWAERPEENNGPVFLSSSCDPEREAKAVW